MAQFVTHIQPTLVEASHHHIPHQHHHKEHKDHKEHYKDYHKDHPKEHHKDHHEKHHKDVADPQQSTKDHHGKEKHGSKIYLSKIGHSPQHYPVLPSTPVTHHHDEHSEFEHAKRDSGKYLDSHGIPHSYQLHFIDSQGIYRDYQGHVEETQEHHEHHHEKEFHHEKEHHFEKESLHESDEVYVRKAVPEDRSPFEKSPSQDKRPTPPQFINLHSVHGVENKNQTASLQLCKTFLRPRKTNVTTLPNSDVLPAVAAPLGVSKRSSILRDVPPAPFPCSEFLEPDKSGNGLFNHRRR